MKFKGTAGLLAAFLVVVLYYFFIEVPAGERKQEEKELSEKILGFNEQDAQKLTLVRGDQSITLKRDENGKWQLVEPVQAPADSFTVDTLVASLANTKFSRIVDENPEDLSVFGLTDPKQKFSVVLSNAQTLHLSLGDSGPIGHSHYLQRNNEKAVLLTNVSNLDWNKSVFDLRDKTILDFPRGAVASVTIERPAGTLKLTRKDKQWTVTGNQSAKGDAGEIKNFLRSLKQSSVKTFIEETPEDLAPFGLDKPHIRLAIAVEGEEDVRTLLIAKENDKKQFLAKRATTANVFTVNKDLVDLLLQSELDFLDKKLLEFENDQLAEISITHEDKTVRLTGTPVENEKNKTDWQIVEPENIPADTATVNSLLFDIKDARLLAYVNQGSNLKSYGLDPAQKKLVLKTRDKQTLGLNLGKQTNDANNFFANRTGESTVFVIDGEAVQKIFRTLHDLKNKKLLHFKSEEVTRIEIKKGDTLFELKKHDDHWNLLKPQTKKNIQPFVAKDILWTLNNLEYEKEISSKQDRSAMGLESPEIQVTVYNQKDKPIGALHLGPPVKDKGELIFARVDGNDATFQVKNRILEELPTDLSRFQN